MLHKCGRALQIIGFAWIAFNVLGVISLVLDGESFGEMAFYGMVESVLPILLIVAGTLCVQKDAKDNPQFEEVD